MPKYAFYLPTDPAPQRVWGWYDTDAQAYPTLPPLADLLVLSPTDWAKRLTGLWAVSGGGLVPYVPPVPGPPPPPPVPFAQQVQNVLANGLSLTSAATPALNAVYPLDADSVLVLMLEMIAIHEIGAFSDGTASTSIPDKIGVGHVFALPDYRAWSVKATAYMIAVRVAIRAGTALPTASVSIP